MNFFNVGGLGVGWLERKVGGGRMGVGCGGRGGGGGGRQSCLSSPPEIESA